MQKYGEHEPFLFRWPVFLFLAIVEPFCSVFRSLFFQQQSFAGPYCQCMEHINRQIVADQGFSNSGKKLYCCWKLWDAIAREETSTMTTEMRYTRHFYLTENMKDTEFQSLHRHEVWFRKNVVRAYSGFQVSCHQKCKFRFRAFMSWFNTNYFIR